MLKVLHNKENYIDLQFSECSSEDEAEKNGLMIHQCNKKVDKDVTNYIKLALKNYSTYYKIKSESITPNIVMCSPQGIAGWAKWKRG